MLKAPVMRKDSSTSILFDVLENDVAAACGIWSAPQALVEKEFEVREVCRSATLFGNGIPLELCGLLDVCDSCLGDEGDLTDVTFNFPCKRAYI